MLDFICIINNFDAFPVPSPSSGDQVSQILASILGEFEIQHRIVQCTNDWGQVSTAGCTRYHDDYTQQNHPRGMFYYFPCFGVTLDRMAFYALQTVRLPLTQVTQVVSFINDSLDHRKIFLDNYKGTTVFQFPLDTSTNFSGSLMMLNLIVEASHAVELVNKNIPELKYQNPITMFDLQLCQYVWKILQRIADAIDRMLVGEYTTIGVVMSCFTEIWDDLKALPDSLGSGTPQNMIGVVKDMLAVAQAFLEWWPIFSPKMQAFLDPRLKHRVFRDELQMDAPHGGCSSWENFIRNYVSTYSFNSGQSNASHEDRMVAGVVAKRLWGAVQNSSGFLTIADELEHYLSAENVQGEQPRGNIEDLLMWWKSNVLFYPKLSQLARDFLSAPVTSRHPEEIFTNKGQKLHQEKASLPYTCTQLLVCNRAWLSEQLLVD